MLAPIIADLVIGLSNIESEWAIQSPSKLHFWLSGQLPLPEVKQKSATDSGPAIGDPARHVLGRAQAAEPHFTTTEVLPDPMEPQIPFRAAKSSGADPVGQEAHVALESQKPTSDSKRLQEVPSGDQPARTARHGRAGQVPEGLLRRQNLSGSQFGGIGKFLTHSIVFTQAGSGQEMSDCVVADPHLVGSSTQVPLELQNPSAWLEYLPHVVLFSRPEK